MPLKMLSTRILIAPPLTALIVIVIIVILCAAQDHRHPAAAVESFLLQPPTSHHHHHASPPIRKQQPSPIITTTQHHAMAPSEQDRLLLTEPAQTAFIVAEMKSFLTDAVERNDGPSGQLMRWELSEKDMLAANLIDGNGTIINEEYQEAKRLMAMNNNSNNNNDIEDCGKLLAINILCNTTRDTFQDGFTNQPGLLSSLGSAICYFRDAFRNGPNLAACERVGLSDYVVAHHITDMYHHRNFRGAYTKTLTPSGTGEIAARIAVGLGDDDDVTKSRQRDDRDDKEEEEEEEDECILWSPTTPDVCIHWKSDDEAWRKKRFERIQMEGTKDPRRGGSGTMR
mmetsp:Transcript_31238/g.62930  ORF Transcript_31238/g.62930 Transcript_31238/m.62930 type:complete len:341 (-) Transcript_31238:39-1061(-)